MKKALTLTAVAVLATAALAQQVSDQPSRANQAARAALLEREKVFAKTGAAKDIERFMSFIADNARSFSAGEMVEGKQGFRQTWSKLFAIPPSPFIGSRASAGSRNPATWGTPVGRMNSHRRILRETLSPGEGVL